MRMTSPAYRFDRRQMMLSERNYGARLRALRALRMLCDKAHLVPHRELVEAAIRDAVAVEIEFVAIGGQNEPAILLREQAHNPSVVWHGVQLHIAAHLTRMVFEQPVSGIESVADRHVNVFMAAVCRRIAADDNLAARNLEVDADVEQIALPLARMAAFDDDAAGNDPFEESVQLFGPLSDARLHRRQGGGVAKSDLNRLLRRRLSVR